MRFKNEEVLNETDRVLANIAARLTEGQNKKWVGLANFQTLTPALSQGEREPTRT